jgi:TIR domain/Pentapeptide repeats (8 copies)
MADEVQLKILMQGVKAWNEWRKQNPGSAVDLLQADLNGMDLRGANLRRANLGMATLIGANLSEGDLSTALLFMAKLVKANLFKAQLGGATLTLADMSGANLRGASCLLTHFSMCTVGEADFSQSEMGMTSLDALDLSAAKGLETVKHDIPSFIGLDTIYRSRGHIPESFLRGAGVPEDFIIYMRSLVGKAIEFYSCFISYSSKDQGFAERLHADLQSKSVRCWFAPEDLKIGDKFRSRIEDSIRLYDKLLVVVSENSIQSSWVEEEVVAAIDKEHRHPGSTVLFPIRLDEAIMETQQAWAASLRRQRHIGDFRDWKEHEKYKKAFDRLLRDLKSTGKTRAS